jgi:hypothetical protein
LVGRPLFDALAFTKEGFKRSFFFEKPLDGGAGRPIAILSVPPTLWSRLWPPSTT